MSSKATGAPAGAAPVQTQAHPPQPQTHPSDGSELRDWLQLGRIEEVECAVPDIAGVARGKVMPAMKFAELSPTQLPVSIFFQTITGDYAEFGGDQFWAEGDLRLVPDLATLRRVPWASSPTAQVINDVEWQTGGPVEYAPRAVLKKVVAQFEARGWCPVVAPELEFYLTKPNPDPDYPLEPPVGRSGRQGAGRQCYSLSAVDEYDKVVDDIYDFAEEQGLEIDTIIQEGGAAQLEINLRHGDPVTLADQAFLFKRTIKEAAFRHNCYATFMAKPMENEPGSSMHIHQSIRDRASGRNIFSDEEGAPSAEFFGFLAGQQRYIAAAMCIFAPYVNSYRRLVPGASAPINLDWGYDNRSTGLRVPVSAPEARRVENRVAGADTNPYLAIAASLACGFLGIDKQLKPSEETSGNAYKNQYDLPRGLQEALNLFQDCSELQGLLGQPFFELYKTVKLEEFEEFMRVISPWEREHLLLGV